MSDNLHRLSQEQGQSPWLDNLQRCDITSGRLTDLVQQGVRGLTSNPTIFQKAIQASTDYDAQFESEIARGLSPREAYWELVLQDIHGALDVFSDLYLSTNGADGFVSVEVDPSLAGDGQATLIAARHLHERVNRPNVMIKIPATFDSLPAIRQMIAEGRNVNVTLIFSLDRYQLVMNAYLEGLESRAAQGLPISHISSVASFFISRVDTEVDSRLLSLDTPEAKQLCGTSAINQARLAYASFLSTFSGPRWESLVGQGARVQRPLWASTSTKNPQFIDTLYVDELIGPDTVNTLPEPTLQAFADHGTVSRTIDIDLKLAKQQWTQLREVGVDIDDVSLKLEQEGVASFIKSFEELISALEAKALQII